MPQSVAEQRRRVGAQRQHQGCHQLHRVEGIGIVRRPDPVMHLDRGFSALQGNVRQFQLERVIAIDINAELITRAA